MKRIGVMIGSPGDAQEERRELTDAIIRWNATVGRSFGVYLEPVKWETHSTPGLQGRPQGMINEDLIPLSDCLIAVFRARAGSSTGKEVSGTIEEIREFVLRGKYVAVYFFAGSVPLNSIDPEQLKTITAFKREIQQQGLTGEYTTVADLAAQVAIHLTSIVQKVIESAGSVTTTDPRDYHTSAADPLPFAIQAAAKSEASLHKSPAARTAESSGNWVLLDSSFYRAQKVATGSDGKISIFIPSGSAEIDSQIEALKPSGFGRSRTVAYAHGNNAWITSVDSITSESSNGKTVWKVSLAPEDVEYGGGMMDVTFNTGGKTYSPDDFARMRAGRILLNEPPPVDDNNRYSVDRIQQMSIEMYIRGSGTPVSVESCVIQDVFRQIGTDQEKFLQLARLTAIYYLRASGVFEHVTKAIVGPVSADSVHVEFIGTRGKKYSNRDPVSFAIVGDCPLPK